MRKLFVTLALAACVAQADADVLYSKDFAAASADEFAAWTVVDANSDGKTWQFDESGSPSRVFYTYHSANSGDDWLISPPIEIPATGAYVLSYEFQGSSYGEDFEVWTGTEASPAGMTEKIATHSDVKSELTGNLAFADLEAGTAYFAFHCTSLPDKFRLYIKSVSLLEASNPVDLLVKEITAPVDGEGLGQETVKVLVENAGRVAVESYDVAYSLNGGDAVVEHVSVPLAAGETYEYTFTTPADLSRGHFTHTLRAWTISDDDINPANDTTETKVKHIAPATIPYSMGFEPDEDMSLMTFLNLNEDDADWGINIGGGWFGNFARTGYGCLAYNYNRENAADDWAFLEPVQMEAGYYALKFWYSATEDHKERMRVYYGTAPTPEAMTLLAEYDPVDNAAYKEAIHIFEVENPGNVYIGFYCFSDADENWLVIDDLTIEQVDPNAFDIIAGPLETPTAVMRAGSITDVNFTLQNVGIVETQVTVNVYLDDVKVASAEHSVRGQEILPVKFEGVLDGISEGNHTVRVEALCEGDTDLDNNVQTKEVIMMGDAVRLWDFEDASLPTDITLRKEDMATDHPDAGDEFNEEGFGIFSLGHVLLGNYALAVNTWFTDDTTADRWIVLPQIDVTGPDSYFVWNANSYNPSALEKYEVCISRTEDKWSSYESVMTVDAESTSPQTRGISLADYEGSPVYVALHVKTKGGEAMIIDNLGIYGDVRLRSVGVATIDEGTFRAAVEDDHLNVYGAETITADIYDVNGARVISTDALSINLTGLARGVYVARISSPAGELTVKFVK